MSYDQSCRNLAEQFSHDWRRDVADKQALVGELAQRIQDAIEDFEQEKEL